MPSRRSSRGCRPWSLRSLRAGQRLARGLGRHPWSFRRRLRSEASQPSGRQVPPAPRGWRRRASESTWAEGRTLRCGHGSRARSNAVVPQAPTAPGSAVRRPACVVGDPAVGRQSRGPTPRPRRVRRTTRLSPRRTGPGRGPGARWRRCGHQGRGRTLCRGSPRHDGSSRSQCRDDPGRRHTALNLASLDPTGTVRLTANPVNVCGQSTKDLSVRFASPCDHCPCDRRTKVVRRSHGEGVCRVGQRPIVGRNSTGGIQGRNTLRL